MGGSPAKSESTSYNPFEQQFGQAVGQFQQANTKELTPYEQQQMQMIGMGGDRAQQQIQQTARDQSTARGMFSSQGAIAQEAAGLSDYELQLAQQRAGIYGQAQNRYMGGLQNVAQLYGSQQRTQENKTGESGGLLGGVGGLVGAGIGTLFGPGGASIGYQLGSGGRTLGGQ